MPAAKHKQILITQVRGGQAATTKWQRDNLRSLGLRGIRKSVVRTDDPVTMGMIKKVSQFVTVEGYTGK